LGSYENFFTAEPLHGASAEVAKERKSKRIAVIARNRRDRENKPLPLMNADDADQTLIRSGKSQVSVPRGIDR